MSDINSVTEGRVTVTANDTEENIRAAAGFAEPEPADESAADGPDSKPASGDGERNPDGTFKARAAKDTTPPAGDDSVPAPKAKDKEGDPRRSIQAKIDLEVRRRGDAERRAEAAERLAQEREQELLTLRQPQAPPQPPAAPTSTSSYLQVVQRYQSLPDAPRYDDFVAAGVEDPYTMHQAAMAAFIADKRHAEREAERQEASERQTHETNLKSSFALAAQAHPEFETLLSQDTRVYPTAVTEHLKVEAALDPSLSAELFHYLLTHPDDAARLATMTHPIAAAREIGRLTAKLSASPGPETSATYQTTAKPLIKPVRPSVMAPESSSPDDLPFGHKYIAAMNERDRKAREARRA